LANEPDAATLEQLYEAFTTLADKKRQILDEDLLTLLHEGFHQAPEVYNLTSLRVTCGTETATAEVRLAGPGFHERSASATGNGPMPRRSPPWARRWAARSKSSICRCSRSRRDATVWAESSCKYASTQIPQRPRRFHGHR